jgi:protocatechuate 3,4-dioxygenase beta subunit
MTEVSWSRLPEDELMRNAPAHCLELVVIASHDETDLTAFVRRLHRHLEALWPRAHGSGGTAWQLTVAVNGPLDIEPLMLDDLTSGLAGVATVYLPEPLDGAELRTRWTASPAEVVAFVDPRSDTDLDRLLLPLTATASVVDLAASSPDDHRPTTDLRTKLLSRRAALLALGGAGAAALLAACSSKSSTSQPASTTSGAAASSTSSGPTSSAAPTTTAAVSTTAAPTTTTPPTTAAPTPVALAPEMTEGPYFLDLNLVRSNIVEDRTGAPLVLNLSVVEASTGRPIQGAMVDVWHCDADGLYSGFLAASTGRGSGTDTSTFLRGAQLTDARGNVAFNTVYPGWYQGRTVHIHVKVRVAGKEIHTGQFFFDDNTTDTIYAATAPYSSRSNRSTRNANDGIYRSGGDASTLAVQPSGAGYAAAMAMGVATT